MKDLSGKNCIVTGAASGIGRSLALGLSREGMHLLLVDIDLAGLEEVCREIGQEGGHALVARCDVSSFDEIKKLEEDARSRLGHVDLLINNAGRGGVNGHVEEFDPSDWARVLDVNLWSIIYSVRTFLPAMIERGCGHIVNTASAAGVFALPYGNPYVVSKFAVIGLTECLYSEIKHAHPGIDVSVICPTGVKTSILDSVEYRLPTKLVTGITEEEFNQRTDEYRKFFYDNVKDLAFDVDKAAKKYIAGIKKGRLYIFDTFLLNLALSAKGNDTLYRWALRFVARDQLKRMKAAYTQMGIKVV